MRRVIFFSLLIIILSVTFFGVLFFIIVRNLLKRKLDQMVKNEKENSFYNTSVIASELVDNGNTAVPELLLVRLDKERF